MKEGFLILLSLGLLFLMFGIKTKVVSQLSTKTFYIVNIISFILSRVIFTIILFLFFGRQGPGDLIDVFYVEALQAKQGSIIYNDFISSYSILFPYLLSLPLYIWNHPLSIAFFLVIFELSVLIISIKYIIPKFNINSREFIWFFILCPLNIIFTVFYIQDEIIITLFMALSFALIIRQKQLIGVSVLVFGFYFTKLISIYFFIPLLLMVDKKYAILLPIVIIATNLILYNLGLDILVPLRESGAVANGPNIWTLLESIGVPVSGKLAYSVLLLLTGMLILYQMRYKASLRGEKVELTHNINFMLIYTLLFMSFSKKSFSFYFLIIIIFYLTIMIRDLNSNNMSIYRMMFRSSQTLNLIYIFLVSILYIFEKEIVSKFSVTFLISYFLIFSTFLLQIVIMYKYLETIILQSSVKRAIKLTLLLLVPFFLF